jgi:hypothetical protein
MDKAMTALMAARLAARFFEELLDSVETWSAVAEQHGVRTLSDLAYLHNAILTGGFIDALPESLRAFPDRHKPAELARSRSYE